jgi:hypothetical protein
MSNIGPFWTVHISWTLKVPREKCIPAGEFAFAGPKNNEKLDCGEEEQWELGSKRYSC